MGKKKRERRGERKEICGHANVADGVGGSQESRRVIHQGHVLLARPKFNGRGRRVRAGAQPSYAGKAEQRSHKALDQPPSLEESQKQRKKKTERKKEKTW